MKRRGFLGLLGKLLAVGGALGVAPEILEPVQARIVKCEWQDVHKIMREQGFVCDDRPNWTLAS